MEPAESYGGKKYEGVSKIKVCIFFFVTALIIIPFIHEFLACFLHNNNCDRKRMKQSQRNNFTPGLKFRISSLLKRMEIQRWLVFKRDRRVTRVQVTLQLANLWQILVHTKHVCRLGSFLS